MSARDAAIIAVTAITGRTILGRIIVPTIVLTTATGLTIIGLMDMATVHIIGLRIIGRMGMVHTDMDPVSESVSGRASVSASAGKSAASDQKKQALLGEPVFFWCSC
jgi:hypothetical protein